jgi:cation:H+ antiporter
VLLDVTLVLAGIVVLAKGADTFVVGAARLAVTLGLSPVVIGAVVIGFGTGAPELLVSTSAAAGGSLDIAVGNVVGSNLANLTLVLGVAGLIARPVSVPRVIRREAPLSLATVALLALLLQDGFTVAEGCVLLGALAVALVLMLRAAEPAVEDEAVRVEAAAIEDLVEQVEEFVQEPGEHELADVARASTSRDVLRTAAGLIGTVLGAQLVVGGAKGIATEIGLSGGFIGLT